MCKGQVAIKTCFFFSDTAAYQPVKSCFTKKLSVSSLESYLGTHSKPSCDCGDTLASTLLKLGTSTVASTNSNTVHIGLAKSFLSVLMTTSNHGTVQNNVRKRLEQDEYIISRKNTLSAGRVRADNHSHLSSFHPLLKDDADFI